MAHKSLLSASVGWTNSDFLIRGAQVQIWQDFRCVFSMTVSEYTGKECSQNKVTQVIRLRRGEKGNFTTDRSKQV